MEKPELQEPAHTHRLNQDWLRLIPSSCLLSDAPGVVSVGPTVTLSEDPGSDCDPDPGHHGGSGSGPDDSRWHGDGAGGPAEADPAAGGDSGQLASDPDSSSPQPRAAARPILLRRVPRSAAPAANRQGPTSPGRHQSKDPRQAQRGRQLIAVSRWTSQLGAGGLPVAPPSSRWS